MNTEPYGITVFCDDIRQEISGKTTLVGCYSTEMNFSAPAPGLLPTLAALVNIRIPASFDFAKITVKVIKEVDKEAPEEMLNADLEVSREDKDRALSNVDNGEKIAVLTFPVRWSPVEFQRPGFIKVRAYLDDTHEIRAGALRVNFPSVEKTLSDNA